MDIVECGKCFTQFRDAPDTAGVCPRCGHENHWATTEDDDAYTDHLRKVTW
jgi:rRNA maturation endonuclease Nob1